MSRELINIVEYLALGELEHEIITHYAHQNVFFEPEERQLVLQRILNQMPPVYMWLSSEDCPDLNQLTPTERQHLHQVVTHEIQEQAQRAAPPPCAQGNLMTEVFY
jgi:hypothetical protein